MDMLKEYYLYNSLWWPGPQQGLLKSYGRYQIDAAQKKTEIQCNSGKPGSCIFTHDNWNWNEKYSPCFSYRGKKTYCLYRLLSASRNDVSTLLYFVNFLLFTLDRQFPLFVRPAISNSINNDWTLFNCIHLFLFGLVWTVCVCCKFCSTHKIIGI